MDGAACLPPPHSLVSPMEHVHHLCTPPLNSRSLRYLLWASCLREVLLCCVVLLLVVLVFALSTDSPIQLAGSVLTCSFLPFFVSGLALRLPFLPQVSWASYLHGCILFVHAISSISLPPRSSSHSSFCQLLLVLPPTSSSESVLLLLLFPHAPSPSPYSPPSLPSSLPPSSPFCRRFGEGGASSPQEEQAEHSRSWRAPILVLSSEAGRTSSSIREPDGNSESNFDLKDDCEGHDDPPPLEEAKTCFPIALHTVSGHTFSMSVCTCSIVFS
mmetsp:Transcript_72907/g.152211  ORF Transcript_72907/g.152211 Transcript_72907/m.152211 type:complete len:272 (+) Transcript_72907:172-987(+)